MSHINVVRIKAVYNALDELKDKVVFVGGATVSFIRKPSTNPYRYFLVLSNFVATVHVG